MDRRSVVAVTLGALMAALVLLVLGCATAPAPAAPAYLCLPAGTDSGQPVAYCRPVQEQATP